MVEAFVVVWCWRLECSWWGTVIERKRVDLDEGFEGSSCATCRPGD